MPDTSAAPDASAAAAAIRLDHVTLKRGDRVVLTDFSLAIPTGKVTAVMGPSGCGKTTVLKLITGQLRPDKGQVWVGDTEVNKLRGADLNHLRRDIGVLLQNGALFTDLTCFDNVALPLREHTKLPEPLIRRLVLLKLQTVGLRGAAGMYPRELSGGMNRRVAMARAMALDPRVMVYDEPFAGLDPISLGASVRLIREINRALAITSVVITHDVAEVPKFADFCCIIADGRVVASGTPDQLHQSDQDVVRQFMKGLPDGPVPFHFPAPPIADDLLAVGVRR
ncbi:MAG: ABC transporter ATP-binding protein [Porticoccaceae bacterium]|nr:ABC transporter ATP-binding protein [Gammaproteobacteria bacterium]TAL02919.1 MAG: ABC transporter ATP-binding protein [Porticoccaceae bacterium]